MRRPSACRWYWHCIACGVGEPPPHTHTHIPSPSTSVYVTSGILMGTLHPSVSSRVCNKPPLPMYPESWPRPCCAHILMTHNHKGLQGARDGLVWLIPGTSFSPSRIGAWNLWRPRWYIARSLVIVPSHTLTSGWGYAEPPAANVSIKFKLPQS